MTSILTGDIVHSRKVAPALWMPRLKAVLQELALADTNWEIYRGDSFQLEIPDIEKAFIAAVKIKAAIKLIKKLDVRIAIGIGKKTHAGTSISEANGDAFIFSGRTLEKIKKSKVNLAIETPYPPLNYELNLFFKLGLIAMDHWTPNSAEIVILGLAHPKASQEMLGNMIQIKQNTVSERQKRAYFEEITEIDRMYRNKIKTLTGY